MGNRIIKESICVSEQIDELDWFEEVFFYRLLVNCDDYGVMDARPKILKARLFPLKEINLEAIVAALQTMIRIGLIRVYEVNELPYLQVIKWGEHQRIRDSKHKYPVENTCGELPQVAASCGELPQDAENSRSRAQPRAGAESESESESESKTESTRARARETEPDEAFLRFWEEYPNRVAKRDAIRAWQKLKPEAELVARIMQGLARWKQSDEWTRDNGRYIPHPATWINGRRWEDEVRGARMVRVVAQNYEQRDYTGVQNELERRQNERILARLQEA